MTDLFSDVDPISVGEPSDYRCPGRWGNGGVDGIHIVAQVDRVIPSVRNTETHLTFTVTPFRTAWTACPLIRRWSSPGTKVVTRLLHNFADTKLIHLGHGKHLHAQKLQEVTVKIKEQPSCT